MCYKRGLGLDSSHEFSTPPQPPAPAPICHRLLRPVRSIPTRCSFLGAEGSLAHHKMGHLRIGVTYASTQWVTCASMGNDGEMWELCAATSSHLTSGWGGVGGWGGWGSHGMIGHHILHPGGLGWGGVGGGDLME